MPAYVTVFTSFEASYKKWTIYMSFYKLLAKDLFTYSSSINNFSERNNQRLALEIDKKRI